MESEPKPSRWRLWSFRLSIVVCSAWMLFLGYLVRSSANPVVVSRPQVLTAGLIVEGVFEDNERFRIQRQWWGQRNLEGATIAVSSDAAEAAARKKNVAYLVPLYANTVPANNGEAYSVVMMPTGETRIYVVTPSVLRQFKELVDFRRKMENGP